MELYIAHKIKETNQIQTVDKHCEDTAKLMEEKCPIVELMAMAWLTGFLHDRGKYSDEFQEYLLNAVEGTGSVRRGDVNHSSAGGRIMEALMPNTLVSKMIQAAVYSHHGLRDCLSPTRGTLLFEWSDDRAGVKQAIERFFAICDRQKLENQCRKAAESASFIKQKIIKFEKEADHSFAYGHREFFLGMYERLLLSLLIEGDRSDTVSFMQGKKTERIPTEQEMGGIMGRMPCKFRKSHKKIKD